MFYLLSAVILYTVAILLTAVASRNLNTVILTAIINTVAAVLPIGFAISLFDKKLLSNHNVGLIAAILAGIVIAFYTLVLNKSFVENKVGIVAPVVWGGAIFLSTILSAILFREKISMLQSVGLAFLGIGFLIIIYVKATGN